MRRALVALVALVVVMTGPAALAQEVPELEPGVATYVPFVDSIIIDGDLADWAAVPSITTDSGPSPAIDPTNTGSVTWQIATSGQALLFAATVVDATIVAGEHGDNYWNEDSVELYVNFSGNAQATQYEPRIGQLTVSPVDLGNTDPSSLTISGNNASDFDVRGFVFATTDGWGLEIEVGLEGLIQPADGATFGLQVHANGSSGGDRDTKLIWSLADLADTSFTDPSVFGTGVFLATETAVGATSTPGASDEESVVAVDEDAVTDPAGDEADASGQVGVIEDELAAEPVVTTVDEPDGNRALLIAAVVSAASIMIGGFWFEHRRKAFEAQNATDAGRSSAPLAIDPPAEPVLRPPPIPTSEATLDDGPPDDDGVPGGGAGAGLS